MQTARLALKPALGPLLSPIGALNEKGASRAPEKSGI